jgi:hypothetical protein
MLEWHTVVGYYKHKLLSSNNLEHEPPWSNILVNIIKSVADIHHIFACESKSVA